MGDTQNTDTAEKAETQEVVQEVTDKSEAPKGPKENFPKFNSDTLGLELMGDGDIDRGHLRVIQRQHLEDSKSGRTEKEKPAEPEGKSKVAPTTTEEDTFVDGRFKGKAEVEKGYRNAEKKLTQVSQELASLKKVVGDPDQLASRLQEAEEAKRVLAEMKSANLTQTAKQVQTEQQPAPEEDSEISDEDLLDGITNNTGKTLNTFMERAIEKWMDRRGDVILEKISKGIDKVVPEINAIRLSAKAQKDLDQLKAAKTDMKEVGPKMSDLLDEHPEWRQKLHTGEWDFERLYDKAKAAILDEMRSSKQKQETEPEVEVEEPKPEEVEKRKIIKKTAAVDGATSIEPGSGAGVQDPWDAHIAWNQSNRIKTTGPKNA
jgi:hypothetical protein